jgi:hypothetical protein
MNLNTIFIIIYHVIEGTPVYVWILLAYLISRGLNAAKVKPLSLSKMLIMPAIFTIWGLDKMFLHFTNLGLDLSFYLMFAVIGTDVGYLLYSRTRKIPFIAPAAMYHLLLF